MSDGAAYQAREDFEIARITAKQFAPDFTQPSKRIFVLLRLRYHSLNFARPLTLKELISPFNKT